MDVQDERQAAIDELYRLVQEQGEQMQTQAARISSLEAALQTSALLAGDLEAPLESSDELRISRALLLKAAAAGAAGLAGASFASVGGEPAWAETAQAGSAALGIAGSWIVSIVYTSGPHRTRGLATFSADGGFVGSVSAYEHTPASPTPSRGTTLHGTWVRTGPRSCAVSAVRLHMDRRGTLLGVMTTQLTATITPGRDAWNGAFTFDAAHPNGRVFKIGRGTLHATRIGRR